MITINKIKQKRGISYLSNVNLLWLTEMLTYLNEYQQLS